MNEKGNLDGIRDKARSLLFSGHITMLGNNCRFTENDVAKKVLVFGTTQKQMKCHFEIDPKNSILINPAIEIKGWKPHPSIRVTLDDNVLSKERYKLEQDNNHLMLWIQLKNKVKVNFN